MLSGKLQTTLHMKKILCNVIPILLGQYCTKQTLCNVVFEASENIAREKILFSSYFGLISFLTMTSCYNQLLIF